MISDKTPLNASFTMSTTDLSASQVEHFKAIDGNLYAKEVTFKPKDWNVGTLLAYRMEEAGVKDYFVIPGQLPR